MAGGVGLRHHRPDSAVHLETARPNLMNQRIRNANPANCLLVCTCLVCLLAACSPDFELELAASCERHAIRGAVSSFSDDLSNALEENSIDSIIEQEGSWGHRQESLSTLLRRCSMHSGDQRYRTILAKAQAKVSVISVSVEGIGRSPALRLKDEKMFLQMQLAELNALIKAL